MSARVSENTTTDMTQTRATPPLTTPARSERPEQQPWHTPEDAKGWQVLARGKRQPRRIAVSVLVEFDHDQSEWLSQEAERTGQDYDEIVKRLVDAQRPGNSGSPGRPEDK
jgi:hypothetical protein